MALREYQRVLLRLYTDSDFLQKFIRDTEVTLNGYALSEREMKSLMGIPKEALGTFQKQLMSKSTNVAHSILERADRTVVLLPFHTKGPILLWRQKNGSFNKRPTTPGEYEILHRIYRTKQHLTLGALLAERNAPRATLRDTLSLVKAMYVNNLTNHAIRVPLVL